MKPALARPVSLLLIMLISVPQSFATCGGGGGGGRGGISPVGPNGDQQQIYSVPWKLLTPTPPAVTEGLVVYWFPASSNELQNSSLRNSRQLSLYASLCVAMEVADLRSEAGKKFAADATLPVAVMATPDGTVIGKVEGKDGRLNEDQVEKLVETEMKRREDSLAQH